jgi:hypothetical protein
MKRYLIRISIIIGILIICQVITFGSILPYIMTDEPVRIPKFLNIISFIFSSPLIILDEDWPWGVKDAFTGISMIIINLLIQAHLILLVIEGKRKLVTNKKSKNTSI